MMSITFQTIGASRYGLFLSMIRQGLFYAPFILVLPKLLGVTGIYFSQPAADLLTILVCIFSIKSMKRISRRKIWELLQRENKHNDIICHCGQPAVWKRRLPNRCHTGKARVFLRAAVSRRTGRKKPA